MKLIQNVMRREIRTVKHCVPQRSFNVKTKPYLQNQYNDMVEKGPRNLLEAIQSLIRTFKTLCATT